MSDLLDEGSINRETSTKDGNTKVDVEPDLIKPDEICTDVLVNKRVGIKTGVTDLCLSGNRMPMTDVEHL